MNRAPAAKDTPIMAFVFLILILVERFGQGRSESWHISNKYYAWILLTSLYIFLMVVGFSKLQLRYRAKICFVLLSKSNLF
jgi:hypothetical protein